MLRIFSKATILSFLIFSLVKCDNYEFPKSPYPRVETLPVVNMSETGFTFQGKIIQYTDQPIINHGFNWGLSDRIITENTNVELGAVSKIKNFESTVEATLNEGDVYIVRAFVITEDYVVYGKEVSFTK